jgi:hypothetical protein
VGQPIYSGTRASVAFDINAFFESAHCHNYLIRPAGQMLVSSFLPATLFVCKVKRNNFARFFMGEMDQLLPRVCVKRRPGSWSGLLIVYVVYEKRESRLRGPSSISVAIAKNTSATGHFMLIVLPVANKNGRDMMKVLSSVS